LTQDIVREYSSVNIYNHVQENDKFFKYKKKITQSQMIEISKSIYEFNFSNIVAISFIGGGNRTKITDLPQVTDKLYHTTLVVLVSRVG
jgi:hypothetical protein